MDHTLQQLDSLYQKIPETICDRRGNCCSILVPITHLEYRRIRQYMNDRWSEAKMHDFWKMVRSHWILRKTAPAESNVKRVPRLQPHCVLFDEENLSCSIYPARPLACRSYGFGSECSLVRLRENPATKAEDTSIHQSLKEIREKVSLLNERYVDPRSHNQVFPRDPMPIEFWFTLEVLEWDSMLDPKDPNYLGRRNDAAEARALLSKLNPRERNHPIYPWNVRQSDPQVPEERAQGDEK